MESQRQEPRRVVWIGLWIGMVAASLIAEHLGVKTFSLPSGLTLLEFIALLAGIAAAYEILALATELSFRFSSKPPVEGLMVSRLYRLLMIFCLITGVAYGIGKLASFGTLFTLFGGMLLGWSLQAPVSGFAAWALVSLMRPFRPGDRVQFPSLGLTGDVQDIGVMYTILNQVGGTIGSEEAVGRYILVPNAMLFSQVVINYTVTQEAAYMLDEVVIRITYDSDWETAERILLDAAEEVTKDIIEATGVKPYIRSDWYDYGVYLRLRYQTRVKDRPEIAYQITKRIFNEFQKAKSVDLAIPYIYSYRVGVGRKASEFPLDKEIQGICEIPIDLIRYKGSQVDQQDIEQLAESIATRGLLQPIVVVRRPQDGAYDILAGHLRFEACKHLGWKTIPAMVRENPVANHEKSHSLDKLP
ncbi:MAG: mechanosensitive ion channel [Firmicutes bacterium]|nr:mechanosensitive ion channel [Bacillota bacterium]